MAGERFFVSEGADAYADKLRQAGEALEQHVGSSWLSAADSSVFGAACVKERFSEFVQTTQSQVSDASQQAKNLSKETDEFLVDVQNGDEEAGRTITEDTQTFLHSNSAITMGAGTGGSAVTAGGGDFRVAVSGDVDSSTSDAGAGQSYAPGAFSSSGHSSYPFGGQDVDSGSGSEGSGAVWGFGSDSGQRPGSFLGGAASGVSAGLSGVTAGSAGAAVAGAAVAGAAVAGGTSSLSSPFAAGATGAAVGGLAAAGGLGLAAVVKLAGAGGSSLGASLSGGASLMGGSAVGVSGLSGGAASASAAGLSASASGASAASASSAAASSAARGTAAMPFMQGSASEEEEEDEDDKKKKKKKKDKDGGSKEADAEDAQEGESPDEPGDADASEGTVPQAGEGEDTGMADIPQPTQGDDQTPTPSVPSPSSDQLSESEEEPPQEEVSFQLFLSGDED